MDDWIPLTCPFCRVRLLIRAKYAHLRGRCPDCGIRIEAPRPKPADPSKYTFTSEENEPIGLLPLDDEEWPEPAIHEQPDHDTSGHYKLADGPQPAGAEKPEVAGSSDIIALAPEAPAEPKPANAMPSQPAAPTPAEDDGEVFTLLPEPLTPAATPAMPPPVAKPQPEPKKAALPPVEPSLELAPVANAHVLDPLDIFQERVSPPPSKPPSVVPDILPAPEPIDAEEVMTPYRLDAPPPEPMPSPPPPVAKLVPPTPADDRDNEEDEEPEEEEPKRPKVNKNSTYQLNPAELKPLRASPPPKAPFIEGLITFPLRIANLKPLIYLSIWFMILGFQCGLMRLILENGGMMAVVAAGVIGLGMIWVVILAGSYAANVFLGILQDTAAGNDEVTYPDYDWKVAFFQFLRIAWVFGLSVVPFMFLGSCLGTWTALMVASIIGAATFPVCLLCSLASDSWIKIIDGQLLARFAKKPQALIIIYVYSVILAVLCVGVFWSTVWTIPLAPIMGIVWAAGLLFYGRLLGRAGYVLTYEKRKKRKKKKRRPAEDEDKEEPADEVEA